ncbi:zinc-binding oxidoreductase ToxD [Obba rivulosa]|uniref:Zinc-binding oxidoreductase ToxD n=1 Tax=Obba rivulosa TaxID=1052685 RepID=A0A8E2DR74_9APHY|nr:zinc-binding oxidoreductase ToxD [Obba rivulosa]
MKALLTQVTRTVAVEEIPVPSITADEILIRTVAVAQNPTDWQYIDLVTNVGTICGCDFSGHVAEVGSNVRDVAIGDHVAGFVHGGNYKDRGAYAEYIKTDPDLVWKVPPGTLTYAQAATMGCAFWTAAQGLFHPMRLGLTHPAAKVTSDEWIFVDGGSTSVGMFALQLAHVAGYKVITVAGPKNHDLCKSYGADVVLDYKDPEVISKIKETTHDSLHLAYDTISQLQSQMFTAKCMAPGAGKFVVIQPPQKAAQAIREDVKIIHTLIYTSGGREFTLGKHYPVSPEDRAHMAAFLKEVPDLVQSGAVKPNPVKLWTGGLEGIKEGLQYMRDGKNSAEKIVYRIAN